MNANQIHEEIKETNLSFMLLAQQMIRSDKKSAMTSFGVNEEMCDLVSGLSPAQLLKMSASNMLLCSFRFDDRMLLNMVGDYKKDGLLKNPDRSLANGAMNNQAVVGRVATRHVGLKSELQANELKVIKTSAASIKNKLEAVAV